MSTIDGENGTVRYTVKELFARIDAKLDSLATVIDAKADHAAVVELEIRVNKLENKEAERSGSSRALWAIVGLLLTIASLLVPIAVEVLR